MTLISLQNSEAVAIIDSIYFEEVNKYNWQLWVSTSGTKYARAWIGKTIYLHQFIAILAKIPNPYPRLIVDLDHRDTDGLNCQVENLRYLPHSENRRRSNRTDNPHKNIQYRPECILNPYRVVFMIRGERKILGPFKTIEEAIVARDSFIVESNLVTN